MNPLTLVIIRFWPSQAALGRLGSAAGKEILREPIRNRQNFASTVNLNPQT